MSATEGTSYGHFDGPQGNETDDMAGLQAAVQRQTKWLLAATARKRLSATPARQSLPGLWLPPVGGAAHELRPRDGSFPCVGVPPLYSGPGQAQRAETQMSAHNLKRGPFLPMRGTLALGTRGLFPNDFNGTRPTKKAVSTQKSTRRVLAGTY